MFKWLFALPLIAFLDPLLLYWIWPHLSFWVQLGGLIVYPLAATLYTRCKTLQEGDVLTRSVRLGTRVAAWYPGPISKVLALFLITPPLERAVVRWAAQLIQKHVLRGMNNANSVPGANPSGAPSPDNGPLPGDEKLKRARGRVIE